MKILDKTDPKCFGEFTNSNECIMFCPQGIRCKLDAMYRKSVTVDLTSLIFGSETQFCGECAFLIPTEREQNKHNMTQRHICRKYDYRVFHHDRHPEIFRCEQCLRGE